MIKSQCLVVLYRFLIVFFPVNSPKVWWSKVQIDRITLNSVTQALSKHLGPTCASARRMMEGVQFCDCQIHNKVAQLQV